MGSADHGATFRHAQELKYMLLRQQVGENLLYDLGVGEPDDGLEIEGCYYIERLLGYQWLYTRATERLDMPSIHSVVELGGGYGGQAEVFLRLNPEIRYVICDIPPWLYIAEIYLKALFPGRVIGYRDTRTMAEGANLLTKMDNARIAIVPAWNWERMSDEFDLFWNSKSLQEMDDNADPYIYSLASKCRQAFLYAYDPPRDGIHSPRHLHERIQKTGAFKEIQCWRSSFERMPGAAMLYERISK